MFSDGHAESVGLIACTPGNIAAISNANFLSNQTLSWAYTLGYTRIKSVDLPE